MDKRAEEFKERVGLTPEEMARLLWDEDGILRDSNHSHNARTIAQAATNKVLNDPDVVLIDREKQIPNIPEFQYDAAENRPYLVRGALNYSKMLTNYYKVIPLAGKKEEKR